MNTPLCAADPDAAFAPPRCPRPSCSAHSPGEPFTYRLRGSFVRELDGRRVQRFDCLACKRSFSTQTFRLDYRLRRPDTLETVFLALSSKTTLRKTGRNLEINKRHVIARLALLARHARDFHEFQLRRIQAGKALEGRFLFDELETYETDRKLQPVTVPVLIEGETGFIVHTGVAPLASRKPTGLAEKTRLARLEQRVGVRRCGSRAAVERTVKELARVVGRTGKVKVLTDKKSTYATLLQERFGDRLEHVRIDGRSERGAKNPLFPINHTLARLRDLVSRLVRETWGASKRRNWLDDHLAVTAAFRNYVDGWRSEPAKKRCVSAAEMLGVLTKRLKVGEFLRWRDPLAAPG